MIVQTPPLGKTSLKAQSDHIDIVRAMSVTGRHPWWKYEIAEAAHSGIGCCSILCSDLLAGSMVQNAAGVTGAIVATLACILSREDVFGLGEECSMLRL